MRELTGGFSWIMSVVMTIDYAGSSAGPTVGSHRVAVWAKRWTKSTRAFAPRSGANASHNRQLKAEWSAAKRRF